MRRSSKYTLRRNKNICVNCCGINYLIQCACGKCNELIPMINKKGKVARFKNGHNAFLRLGDKNPNWLGGRKKDKNGYWFLLMPDYFSSNSGGYVLEHIYFYQEYYKCCLLPWGVVHHKEPVTKDYCNNMIWNLQGMTNSQHISYHHKGKVGKRKDHSKTICLLCGSNKTKKQSGRNYGYDWFVYGDGYICHKCYMKEYHKIRKRQSL